MNKHEAEKKITRDILAVTARIQTEYPELYLLLTETPLFLVNGKIRLTDYEQYLESLAMQFRVFSHAAAHNNIRE